MSEIKLECLKLFILHFFTSERTWPARRSSCLAISWSWAATRLASIVVFCFSVLFFFLLVLILVLSSAIHFLFPRFPFSSPPFQSLPGMFLSLVLPLVIAVKMSDLPMIIRLLLLSYVTQV